MGREWLLRQGIDRQDFVTLVKMSAWATCGTTHVHGAWVLCVGVGVFSCVYTRIHVCICVYTCILLTDDNQETTNTDTTTTASTAPETTTASYSHPR